MEFVTGLEDRKVKTLEELEREESVGTEVTVEGMVHSIRDMGEISFVILRSRDGLFLENSSSHANCLTFTDLGEDFLSGSCLDHGL